MAGSEEEEEEEEGERRRRGVLGRRRKRGGGGITGCAGQPGLLCPGEGGRGDGGEGAGNGELSKGCPGDASSCPAWWVLPAGISCGMPCPPHPVFGGCGDYEHPNHRRGGQRSSPSTHLTLTLSFPVCPVRRDRQLHAAQRHQPQRAGAGGDGLQSRGPGEPGVVGSGWWPEALSRGFVPLQR